MDRSSTSKSTRFTPLVAVTALQVEITSYCNLTCKMCPLTMGATLSSVTAAHMKETVWREVLKAAPSVGRVIMTGFGENAINPKFTTLLRQLDEMGIRTSFTTNGHAITPALVKELAQLKLMDHVNVSIDSPDPAIYREVRGGPMERAWAGLRALADGLPHHVFLTISSVVMANNVESLRIMPSLMKLYRVNGYFLQGLHDRTLSLTQSDPRLNPCTPEVVRGIEEQCAELGIMLDLDRGNILGPALETGEQTEQNARKFAQGLTRQCTAPWHYPFIDRAGRVFPCCHGDDTAVMGDLSESSYEAIWNSQRFAAFRAGLLSGRDMPDLCRKCRVASIGTHPFNFASQVVWDRCRTKKRDRMRLTIQNVGNLAFSPEFSVKLVISGGRSSELYCDDWESPTEVMPLPVDRLECGECVTMSFRVSPLPDIPQEEFQLVISGPNMERHVMDTFHLTIPPRGHDRSDKAHSLYSLARRGKHAIARFLKHKHT